MKNLRNKKTKFTAILIVVLLMTSVFMLVAATQAQTEYTNIQEGGSIPLPSGVTPDLTLETIAYLSYRPQTIGIGQAFLINIWLQPPLHISRYFTEYTVTITNPSGTEIAIGPIDSYRGDTSAWFEWIGDVVGTWTLKFDFPGGYFPSGNYTRIERYGGSDTVYSFEESVYYEASSAGPYELEVQEDIVYSWPASELPTDYWTRPVSPENREWWPILGDYPYSGKGGGAYWPADTNIYNNPDYAFTPYVQGPETAHIVWKRMSEAGGLIGGDLGQTSFYTGGGFGRAPNLPDLIVSGRVYQEIVKVVDGVITDVWQCYDLRTGDVYWEQTGVTRIPNRVAHIGGQYVAVPGAGAHMRGMGVQLVYIGGGRMVKYDPFTGDVIADISIAPLSSATLYADPYALGVQNLGGGNRRLINWTIAETERNVVQGFEERVVSNITWPLSNIGDVQDFESGIAVDYSNIGHEATGVTVNVRLRGVSLTTGQVLWDITTDTGYGLFSGSTAVADHGKFAVRFNDGHWHCWDLYTGAKLWKSELSSYPWGTFGAYDVASAYGNIYSMAYDGVSAFDWDTGKVVWTYNAQTPYTYETPYEGNYPFFSRAQVADGKVFTYNNEHTISQPLARGYRLHCIDAFTGDGIWNITGYMQAGAIADGYLIGDNMYDGYLYTFGKGMSATTVTAPDVAVPKGTSVLIKGTVLDQSPAQPDTPCVSADSMPVYMEYLHMQKPIPDDFTVTGVPVKLAYMLPDGDWKDIDEVTSDDHGNFGYLWTPPDEGTYVVKATFLGSDAYGSSSATTYLGVGPAPSPASPIEPEPTTPEPTQPEPTTPEPTQPEPTEPEPTTPEPTEPEPTTPTEAPFITTEIAILAAVAIASIIGIVSFLALKKRK